MSYAEKREGKLSGRWVGEVDHRHKGGPRFRMAFETKRQADAYEAYVKHCGEPPPGLTGDDTGRTFAAVAQELKEAGGPDGVWARGRDKAVLQRLDTLMGHHRIGRAPIASVNYAMAEGLVQELAKKPGRNGLGKMSEHTINRYLTALSAVLGYAEVKGYISRAPKLPWRKPPRRKQPLYKPGQIDAAVAWLREHGRPREAFLVEVLERTGMRVGELLGLQREQIEDEFITLDDPELIKNEECRVCWVGPEMARELRALIVAPGGLGPYHKLAEWVKKANKAVGNSIVRPLHSIRHTAATNTVAAEQDIQVAQQLLGHKDINTTLRYRHVSREVLRERAQKVSQRRGETGAQAEVLPFKSPAKAV